MTLLQLIEDLWPHVVAFLTLFVSVVASGHVVLHKRDARAAVAWVGLVWLVPLVGAVLYVLLGINRIRRRAHSLRAEKLPLPRETAAGGLLPEALAGQVPQAAHLAPLVRLGHAVIQRPLLPGNRVDILEGGHAAYPAMLEAIEAAQQSISLCTYIFDNDEVGARFVAALARAVERGVEARVLIDAVGVRYTSPPIHRHLRRAGVRVALFLPTLAPARLPFVNLRNHRKVMVVDGRMGFTGGMNIRAAFAPEPGRPAAQDLHFRLQGPVVAQLQESMARDWEFTTREVLAGERWFPPLEECGPALARGISDGPDEDFETLRWVLLGALASARHSVRIITPYFLPDMALVTALNVAALRGVRVDILLPSRSNLPLVQWASTAQLWQNLQHGCRIALSPPPFDHSKLMVVDGVWALIGSANWDPRSLRLNFEFNVECYEPALAARLDALVKSRMEGAQPLSLRGVDARPLPVRLRDGLARLLSPYL
jgi:cardiolipin synthase